MTLDPRDPATWIRIQDDASLKHLAENRDFYDGDVHEDLERMRACGLLLVREFPGVGLRLQFEDDGMMHIEVLAPDHAPADVGVVHGRYSVFIGAGSPDEHDVPAESARDVANSIRATRGWDPVSKRE